MSGDAGPDVEGALKAYLQADTGMLAAPCGARTWLAVGRDAVFPYNVITRIGGGETSSDAPIDDGLVQIDIFGRVLQLTEADQCRRAVRKALAALTGTPYTASGKGKLLGAVVRDDRRQPIQDAQDGAVVGERPRYILTVAVTCIDA